MYYIRRQRKSNRKLGEGRRTEIEFSMSFAHLIAATLKNSAKDLALISIFLVEIGISGRGEGGKATILGLGRGIVSLSLLLILRDLLLNYSSC